MSKKMNTFNSFVTIFSSKSTFHFCYKKWTGKHRCSRATLRFLRIIFFLKVASYFFFIDDTTMAIEDCNKVSISTTRVKSTKIGLKETESNKACTRVIRKKSYELVRFLRSYDVNKVFYRVFARMYGY